MQECGASGAGLRLRRREGSNCHCPFALCVAGPAPAPSAPRDAYAASVDATSFYDAEMERMVRSIKAQHNAVITKKARITVTMKQPRYPTQTVKAVNYSMPGLRFGAIAPTVPDIEKAIE